MEGLIKFLGIDPVIMDYIKICIGIFAFIEFLMLFIVWYYSRDMTWFTLKSTMLKKIYAMGICHTTSNRIALEIPVITPEDPEHWIFTRGNKESPLRVPVDRVYNGPDRMDVAIYHEGDMEAMDLKSKSDSQLFGTSGYIEKLKDLSHAEGYLEGFDDSKSKNNIFGQLMDNWQAVAVILIIVGIGVTFMYDKIYTGPQGWQAANTCETQKSQILAQCSKYIDFNSASSPGNAPPQASNIGAVVT